MKKITSREEAGRDLVAAVREITAKDKRIDVIRRILEDSSAEKIDGVLMDVVTANMLKTVYEALKPKLQKKFDDIPIRKLVDFGWSMVR